MSTPNLANISEDYCQEYNRWTKVSSTWYRYYM